MFHMLWKWRIYNVMKMNGWIQDSPWEGTPTFREGTSIRFWQNFQKLHENENILGRRGWDALPDPPMRWDEANAVEIMNILVLIKHCVCYSTFKRIKEMKTFRCTMFRHCVFISPPPPSPPTISQGFVGFWPFLRDFAQNILYIFRALLAFVVICLVIISEWAPLSHRLL